ncbi:hypothetical protein [Streptomyces sp. NPDC090021]|uniref:COG1470 family protein n=1 Tax=Streptomyces sp. NPDC090021 TaxID=3365919 RepID=UPI00381041DB
MGVIASLEEPDGPVEPGTESVRLLKLHNTGHVVDTFVLDVLGEAAGWITVRPEAVNVFPGQDETAEVVFTPPRESGVGCGPKSFAVRVVSMEDTAGSTVQESTIEVAPFTETACELVPRTVRGRRTARTRLAVDNFGNGPVSVELSGRDEDSAVEFRFSPGHLVVDPGTTRLVPVRIRLKNRFLTGPPRSLPVEVAVLGTDGSCERTTGAVVQLALLPRWLLKAGLFAAAGAVLAFTVLPGVLNAAPKSQAVAAEQTATAQAAAPEPSPSGTPASVTGQTPPAGAQPGAQGYAATTDANGTAHGSATVGQPGSGSAGGTAGSPQTQGQPQAQANTTPAGTGGAADQNAATTPPPAPRPAPAPPKSGAGPAAQDQAASFDLTANVAPTAAGRYSLYKHVVPAGQTLTVDRIALQNPNGNRGSLEIRRDGTRLLYRGLNTLQYENVSARHTFKAGEAVVLAVNCTASTRGSCTPKASFSGTVTRN